VLRPGELLGLSKGDRRAVLDLEMLGALESAEREAAIAKKLEVFHGK
jgi:hypothetical protein